MRQMISGLVAAIAVMTASAVPAMACGGLFDGGCSPCGYVSPCAQAYVPTYSGCNTGCGGWGYHERLPDPELQYGAVAAGSPQYYYADQGPTYTGPGNFAPYPAYQESAVSGWGYRHHRRHYGYGYMPHHSMRYGYGAPHRYGYAHHYGYREHVLRRYY